MIGIVTSINDIVHGKSKQNKDYTKRDIIILDRTGQILVTLWYRIVCKKLIKIPYKIFNYTYILG